MSPRRWNDRGAREDDVQAKPKRQVGNDAEHRRGDGGKCGGREAIAPQIFGKRGAGKNP
jgi:hypothetical protein